MEKTVKLVNNKKITKRDLKIYFPLVYKEIQNKNLTKKIETTLNKNTIENNIQKGVKLIFG